MGVDTRGALGDEAPPLQIFRLYIIHYVKIVELDQILVVINLNIGLSCDTKKCT